MRPPFEIPRRCPLSPLTDLWIIEESNVMLWRSSAVDGEQAPLLKNELPSPHGLRQECEDAVLGLRRLAQAPAGAQDAAAVAIQNRAKAALRALRLKAVATRNPLGHSLTRESDGVKHAQAEEIDSVTARRLEHALTSELHGLDRAIAAHHQRQLAGNHDLGDNASHHSRGLSTDVEAGGARSRPWGMLSETSVDTVRTNERLLAESSSILSGIQHSLEETQELGLDSLERMDAQGEALRNSAKRGVSTRSFLSRTSRALRDLWCRAAGDRLLLALMAVVLVAILLLLTYFVLLRRDPLLTTPQTPQYHPLPRRAT